MREWQEQRALIEWCRLMERRYPELRWLYHVPNGELREPATAAKLKAMGVKPGVPDLVLPVPKRDYHGLYLEMKGEKGRLSPRQEEWAAYLAEAGYCFAVGRGWQDAVKKIMGYLGYGV